MIKYWIQIEIVQFKRIHVQHKSEIPSSSKNFDHVQYIYNFIKTSIFLILLNKIVKTRHDSLIGTVPSIYISVFESDPGIEPKIH